MSDNSKFPEIFQTKPAGQSFWYDVVWDLWQMLALFDKPRNSRSLLWCIFGMDAYLILFIFRLRQLAKRYSIPLVNRILRGWQVLRYGIEISIDSPLGHGVTFLHSVGITIEGRIDNGVIFMGGNTVGFAGREKTGVPHIGAGAVVGCGAKILGDIHVGVASKIGANAVIMSDVPDGGITLIKPTRAVKMNAS